jgi:hypothetical protein
MPVQTPFGRGVHGAMPVQTPFGRGVHGAMPVQTNPVFRMAY